MLVNCILGFKRVYGIDPTSVFTPRRVAVVFPIARAR
jgi:hypothetical protein